jgi:glycosyltransferase involved in cell wall biosynthesis
LDGKFITISVVIPCFNSEQTILRALNSVINQTYLEFEIIIVDDGSIDNTKELIEDFFKDKQNKYKYIYQDNSGPSTARNNGVQNAIGEYIAFLDSDDEWHPQKLELQMKIIKDNDLLFLGSTYTYNDLKDENIEKVNLIEYSFKKLIWSNKFSTPGVMIKKSFFEELDGFDIFMKYAEDYDLWLRASLREDLYLISTPKLFRLYKAAYGNAGLSSHMYPMYKGELYLLKKLKQMKSLNSIEYIFIKTISTFKFFKRLVLNNLKAKQKNWKM